MATVKCRECGGVVSTSAKACPHCGAPSNKFKPRMGIGKFLLWGFGFLILIRIISPANENTPSPAATPPAKASQTSETSPASGAARPSVLSQIVDDKKGTPIKAGSPTTKSSESGFTDAQVCKAAIATIMGRPVSGMDSATGSGGIAGVSYIRSQDKQKFEYQCKVASPNVVWRTKIDGSWGRWRDHPDDGKITFKMSDGILSIAESYGGSDATVKSFSAKDF